MNAPPTAVVLALLAGVLDLAIAAFHLTFWRLFGWPKRLATLDAVNRALPPVLNIALTGFFIVIGFALVTAPAEALSTTFARRIVAGTAVVWLVRAAIQIPYFGLRHPASILLFAVFLLGFVLHGAPLLY
jgi:hypothetical protein